MLNYGAMPEIAETIGFLAVKNSDGSPETPYLFGGFLVGQNALYDLLSGPGQGVGSKTALLSRLVQ